MTGTGRRRTILFLIADTGAGHRSAANAIVRAMSELQRQQRRQALAAHGQHPSSATPAHNVVIVDAFEECSHFPLRNGVFLYGPAIKYSPRLYGQIYRATNSTQRFEAARRICQPFLRQGLRRLIERIQPDVIVSVHPLLNHITLQVLRDIGIRIPVLTVVTDLVSIHCAWFARGIDAYSVPTETARQLALGAGVAAKRVRLLGMPIDAKFAHTPERTCEQFRAELGLDPNLPVILLVGGGEGAGGLRLAAETLKYVALPAQVAIITGRNQRLRADLQRELGEFTMPAHVFGFVENMPTFMRAADVIVTKAGPGTICEALACGLPIILTGAVPGQEEGNIDYVLDNEVGLYAPTPDDLVAALDHLLGASGGELGRLRENARRLSHAQASFDIARLILSYVPAGRAPSVWSGQPRRTMARSRQARVTVLRRAVASRIPPLPTRARLGARRGIRRGAAGTAHVPDRSYVFGLARMAEVRRLLRRERDAKV
jgi:1,2-diacylglycerol 3-beta-galactosyltransferase